MKTTKNETNKIKNLALVRRQVMTLAHTLNKELNNLSEACKKAWAIVKGRKIYANVAGVSFNNRKAVLATVTKAMAENKKVKTTLEREPENEFDKNAIKVNVRIDDGENVQLGYVSADLAKQLAPIIDKVGMIKTHIYKTVSWTAKMVIWLN